MTIFHLKIVKSKITFVFIFVFVIVVSGAIYHWYYNLLEAIKPNVIITRSATFFGSSKFYKNNTLAMLFLAETSTYPFLKLVCHSKNATNHTLVSHTTLRSAHTPMPYCKLHLFVATCESVMNPTRLHLGDSEKTDSVPVPLRYPVQEKLPLVSCVSSLYLVERFQQIILSIEVYHYFGVNRQVYYSISSLEGIYNLLKEYQKLKIIDLYDWSLPDIFEFESKPEISVRDQAGALNDCYMNYREAADFIIIHDVDELIFPFDSSSLYADLVQLWQKHPNTANFQYVAFAAVTRAAKDLNSFNMSDVLNSLVINDYEWDGKSVYNTSLVETVWLHWAYLNDTRIPFVKVRPEKGILAHVRHWNFNVSKNRNELMESTRDTEHVQNKVLSPNSWYPKITDLISDEVVEAIDKQFHDRVKYFTSTNPKLMTMLASDYYYTVADKCVGKIRTNSGCETNYACHIPPIFDLKCIQAKQEFLKRAINPHLIIYYPKNRRKTVLFTNGCNVY